MIEWEWALHAIFEPIRLEKDIERSFFAHMGITWVLPTIGLNCLNLMVYQCLSSFSPWKLTFWAIHHLRTKPGWSWEAEVPALLLRTSWNQPDWAAALHVICCNSLNLWKFEHTPIHYGYISTYNWNRTSNLDVWSRSGAQLLCILTDSYQVIWYGSKMI